LFIAHTRANEGGSGFSRDAFVKSIAAEAGPTAMRVLVVADSPSCGAWAGVEACRRPVAPSVAA